MAKRKHTVFVSHGWADKWVAEQIALRLQRDCGCRTFIDVFDIEKGDDIAGRIREELPHCHELVVLFTPWSVNRKWLWVELGAAWFGGLRIAAVLYGLTLEDIDREYGGKTFLGAKNLVDINDLETYLSEVKRRATR